MNINTKTWLPAKQALKLAGVNKRYFYEAVDERIIRTKPAWDNVRLYNAKDIKKYWKR